MLRYSWDAGLAAAPEVTNHFHAAVQSHSAPDLELIDVPVLIVAAGADRFRSASTEQLFPERFPLLKRMTIAGAPHGLLWTHAAEINAALLRFIDG
jgi:peroxiredoxin